MKRKSSVLAVCFISAVLFAQQTNDAVLMTINGAPVFKSEFEYMYNKNKLQSSSGTKSLNEYADLFVTYKLKVLEAEAIGIDTTKAFRDELAKYRQQLAAPYLFDSAAVNRYAQEAYDRMQKEINVSHILIKVAPNATAADTLAAYTRIMAIRNRALERQNDSQEGFQAIAGEVSEDPSARDNGGNIGYITGFTTIYPFETAAYNTPVGAVSKPVRTLFGYHLIRVNGSRPSRGEVHVAHIMKFTMRAVNDSTIIKRARQVIDSAYQLVASGADFASVARSVSDDKSSAVNGGVLPWFGVGYMVKPFEDAAFSLKQGDISKPFQSLYGWHIVKLLDQRPLAPYAEKKQEIIRRLMQDDRAGLIVQSFVDKLKKEYNFNAVNGAVNPFYKLAATYALKDSLFNVEASKLSAPMFSFAGQTVNQKDFASFLHDFPTTQKSIPQEIIDDKYTHFVNNTLMKYEDSRLEAKYPALRNLVREYHDGLLLYAVSNQDVWDRAIKDTDGLKKFFNANKSRYAWKEPRFKGIVVYCKDEATQTKAKELMAQAPKDSVDVYLMKNLNKVNSAAAVQVEKGVFAQGDNKAVDKYRFNTGDFTPSGNFPVVFTEGRLINAPEEYTDVRGPVTSDYQDFLETMWVSSLHKKYPVTINQEVLNSIK